MANTVLDQADVDRFIKQMGYSYVDESQANALCCPICEEVFSNPVTCDHQHTFCHDCISEWLQTSDRCPADQASPMTMANYRNAPLLIKQMVDALVVCCPLGCGWKGSRSEFPNHLARYCPDVEINNKRRGKPDGEDTTAFHTGKDEPTSLDWEQTIMKISLLESKLEEQEKEKKEQAKLLETAQARIADLETRTAAPSVAAAPAKAKGKGKKTASPKKRSATEIEVVVCNLCKANILEDYFKCLRCPDFDTCAECFAQINKKHPGHDFVRLHEAQDYVPATKKPRVVKHTGIECNLCLQNPIEGIRYTCSQCADFDVCEACVVLPTYKHTASHNLIRIAVAQPKSRASNAQRISISSSSV